MMRRGRQNYAGGRSYFWAQSDNPKSAQTQRSAMPRAMSARREDELVSGWGVRAANAFGLGDRVSKI